MKIETKKTVFHGPNLHAGFAGILAEFKDPYQTTYSCTKIFDTLNDLFGDDFNAQQLQHSNQSYTYVQCCAFVITKIYCPLPFFKKQYIVAGYNKALDVSRLYLRFLRLTPASLAIDLALEISSAIFSSLSQKTLKKVDVKAILNQKQTITDLEVTADMQLLIKIALERDIPMYATTKTLSRLWHYGQGSRSLFTMFTVSQKDSVVARDLSQNKDWSNEFIQKLGFPAVQHYMTRSYEEALMALERLGYPVVIKPVPGTMGRGVTSDITNLPDFKAAYRLASKHLSRGVLVERHVDGIDHRLMVVSKKLIWISAKYPASITGDGERTIIELIEQENQRREKSDDTKKQIPIDKVTRDILASEQFSLEDRPAKGRIIPLRKVANLEMAGVRRDVTDRAHPDNIALAETVARIFHMSVMGMDFIIEDIAKSWRDVPCAIIEINQIPGFSVAWQAERMIDSMFPNRANGRIPTILNLINNPKIKNKLTKPFQVANLRLGQTTAHETLLEDHNRGKPSDPTQIRVNSLIADPHCDALIVHTDTDSMIQNGLPLDRFDLAILPENFPQNLKTFIQTHCRKVIESFSDEQLSSELHQMIQHFLSSLNPEEIG